MDSHYDVLDLNEEDIGGLVTNVKYAATHEEHTANVQAAIALGLPSLERGVLTSEPIAVVCSGPSLRHTRRDIRHFDKILTCSGAHQYLIDHGIIPTWHMEGDPRPHKVFAVKRPHRRVQYLIASSCHPKVFEALKGYDVRVWHTLREATHLTELDHYPKDHWVLTGGTNVGIRALVMARILGFTTVHLFGMDCSAEDTMHTGDHPNEPPKTKYRTVRVGEQDYQTTTTFLSYAKQFFHEMLQLPDVNVIMHGEGLLQALVRQKLEDPERLQAWIDERENVIQTTIAVAQRGDHAPAL